MRYTLVSLFFAGALILPIHATLAALITVDTVPVGDPGNAGDVQPQGVFGAVAHEYRIGTYEVTNDQYAAFLNAKAASDPLNLYSVNMASNPRAGIVRSGVSGSYTYSVKPDMGNKPVNYVNWFDAVRFSNWLHNGQGAGDTETGAYTLLGGTPLPSNSASIARNPGAVWFLPSEDEWYKAAYYQPALVGGDVDDYWHYPTATNTLPTIATDDAVGNISNPGANVANYNFGADWNGQHGNVTTVGSAGPLSTSYYGTYDQGGNVLEWNETLTSSTLRGMRGGGWGLSGVPLAADFRFQVGPLSKDGGTFGFRVATVPEPSTLVLAGLAGLAILSARRRQTS
jgi:sulfatase modifying factor 1